MICGSDGAQSRICDQSVPKAVPSINSLLDLPFVTHFQRTHLLDAMDACLKNYENCWSSTPITPTISSSSEVETPRRVAKWDIIREQCNNCHHIYLKTLSKHLGFCSVDCKSNMAYLQKVNRTIRAMKDAVDERQRPRQQSRKEKPVMQQPTDESSRLSLKIARNIKHAQSFAEFDREARATSTCDVEWSFSVY
ncbi:hypothetical protein CCR75_006710 [Bremia lactucae]|uniref:Uncharacterized protein n=1 Tax=Bremia lactucae TaxID=4779 RepID=A0A976FFK7_BRELC|nr:hypothetical protein CCR75_006710 [Bremia lactucae]